jgi:hypothetical protein
MKLLFPHRPWESEPDTAEWFDAITGYKCRIERQTSSGTLCGYVGVFKGHPLHGVRYNDAEWDNPMLETRVHGGLTFSNTDKNGVHWFGFDTAHAGDFCPGIVKSMLKYAPESDTKGRWMQGANGVFKDETYRTWEYVEGEVHKLVRALWKVENPRLGDYGDYWLEPT